MSDVARAVGTQKSLSYRLLFGVSKVTIDKSLRRKGRLSRSRNVLKRAERIERLELEERWKDDQSPLGLPKVRVLKQTVGRKKKKKAKDEDEADTGTKKKS